MTYIPHKHPKLSIALSASPEVEETEAPSEVR